jgi:glycosyltransferase involved in cell wall biosynthesis
LKIVQVCSGVNGFGRGAESFCLSLAAELANSGNEVLLVVGVNQLDSVPPTPISCETIPCVSNKLLRKLFFDYFNPKAYFKFRRLMKETKPDVVHLHSLYGISSMLVRAAVNVAPTFVTFHDMWPVFYDPPKIKPNARFANTWWKAPLGWFHRKINLFCFRNAAVVSPARWLIAYSKNIGYQNQFYHIPPAVSADVSTTSHQRNILWVGEIKESKGLESILGPMVDATKKWDWSVTILGDGPDRTRLQAQYPDAKFMGRVDPSPFYQRSSILVVSSIQPETGPLVLLEGMAAGLCVIGKQVGGVKEIIADQQDGLLYDSISSFERKVEFALRDDSYRKKLGEAAQQKIREKYSWNRCVEKHFLVYSGRVL